MTENPLDELRSNSLGRLTTRVVAAIERELATRQVVAVDISPAQKAVLIQLETTGNRITTLAARLGISKQATSKLVQELETKGLVARTPDPADGRASQIIFTASGLELVEGTVGYFRELEARLADEIGPEDLALVKSKLKAIARILDPEGF